MSPLRRLGLRGESLRAQRKLGTIGGSWRRRHQYAYIQRWRRGLYWLPFPTRVRISVTVRVNHEM